MLNFCSQPRRSNSKASGRTTSCVFPPVIWQYLELIIIYTGHSYYANMILPDSLKAIMDAGLHRRQQNTNTPMPVPRSLSPASLRSDDSQVPIDPQLLLTDLPITPGTDTPAATRTNTQGTRPTFSGNQSLFQYRADGEEADDDNDDAESDDERGHGEREDMADIMYMQPLTQAQTSSLLQLARQTATKLGLNEAQTEDVVNYAQASILTLVLCLSWHFVPRIHIRTQIHTSCSSLFFSSVKPRGTSSYTVRW